MKRLVFLSLLFTLAAFVSAQSLTGRQIMELSDQVPEPETSSYTATMTLTGKNGKNRIRQVSMKSKDYETALKMGTAAGSATAFSDGLAKAVDINNLYKGLN